MEELIETILSLKDIPQSPKWHPEGDTLEHVKFIIHGLHNKYRHDFITLEEREFLTLVALFHDLGKIDTLTIDEKGIPHAYGHENYAEKYIDKFKQYILPWHDIQKLKLFCRQHMKAHLYMGDQMGLQKKINFRDSFTSHDFYLLMVFESCDNTYELYKFLRRLPEYVEYACLPPNKFFDIVRGEMIHCFDDNEIFVNYIKGVLS